jgi:biopolymer transport protein ExbD
MRFTTRKQRQAPAVIIISLIDILIVLLIFLMVTTTFKQTPALRISLPQSNVAPKPGASQNPMMIVTISKSAPHLYLNQRAVTLSKLQEEFTAAMARDTNAAVAIRPDEDSSVQHFIDVMVAASAAKIKSVPIFTRPKK